MLRSFNEREGEWVCARVQVCVCVRGAGVGGGVLSIFPTRFQYRSESNTDMIFSIIL